MATEKVQTVPAVAAMPCVVFGVSGASRNIEKGESVEWLASDFDRACESGLIKSATKDKK